MKRVSLIAAILLMFSPALSFAASVEVGTCISGLTHFTKIQDAVNAVAAGSTVFVCPGKYAEQVTITQSLTLAGVSSGNADNPTIVVPSGGVVQNSTRQFFEPGRDIAAQVLVDSAGTVNISNLTIDGTGDLIASNFGCPNPILIGIYYRDSSGTVNHVRVLNQAPDLNFASCNLSKGFGIYQDTNGSTVVNVKVNNSILRGFSRIGIAAGSPGGTTVSFSQNSIEGPGAGNTFISNGIQVITAAATVSGNSIANNAFANADSDSTGFLCTGCHAAKILSNVLANNINGIALQSDSTEGDADLSTIRSNTLIESGFGLQNESALYACSNSNIIQANQISDTFEQTGPAIQIDSSCVSGAGNNNTVKGNTLNGACVGTLVSSGTTGNIFSGNSTFNVANVTLSGQSCSAAFAAVRNPVAGKRGQLQ